MRTITTPTIPLATPRQFRFQRPIMPRNISALLPFLALLFTGTVCSAMIIPYMAYFLVEGLGRDPWMISVYSLLAISLTVTVNRRFARHIDAGQPVFPLVGLAATGYLTATAVLSVTPNVWTVMTIGVLGFGLSSSAVSTMFSLGGNMAERQGVDRVRFNAFMRATTSTAWMIGPAISFLVADQVSPVAVFRLALGAALLWLVLWWRFLPKDVTAPPKPATDKTSGKATGTPNTALWAAAAFVFCMAFGHSLTFSALPLFFVREIGLPGYAPGVAFSVKTFVEVLAIFSTPFLVRRFGLRPSLLATAALAALAIQVLSAVTSFPQMVFGAALEGLYYGLFASLGISYIQSFAQDRPAQATAIYWNILMISGLMAGPAVGAIAQVRDFHSVIQLASGVAIVAFVVLLVSPRET